MNPVTVLLCLIITTTAPPRVCSLLDLAGLAARSRLVVVKGDIRSGADLRISFSASPAGQPIDAVIHFAFAG